MDFPDLNSGSVPRATLTPYPCWQQPSSANYSQEDGGQDLSPRNILKVSTRGKVLAAVFLKIKSISNLYFLGFLFVAYIHGHGYACMWPSFIRFQTSNHLFFFFETGSLSGLGLTDWQGWPVSPRHSPVPTCPALGSHIPPRQAFLWTPEMAFRSCGYRTSISLAELPLSHRPFCSLIHSTSSSVPTNERGEAFSHLLLPHPPPWD